MEFKAILSSDADFTRTKEALKWLWGLRKEIELHEIQIKPYKRNRSLEANRYLWGVVVTPMASHCGYTPEEMHEVLLHQIYGTKVVEFGGRKCELPNRRTHDMNTKEFAEHIEHCTRIASDLGVMIEPYERME